MIIICNALLKIIILIERDKFTLEKTLFERKKFNN